MDNIWAKTQPIPESVTDRPTKAHEYLFLLANAERYYWNKNAILEPLATNPKENYPARAKVLPRGSQDFAEARGGDRGKSGGFPPSKPRTSGNVARKLADGTNSKLNTHMGSSVPWTSEGVVGRNKRSVWTLPAQQFGWEMCSACKTVYDASQYRRLTPAFPPALANKRLCSTCGSWQHWLSHFAVMPEALVEPCILAGCPPGGWVCDPFSGAGTVSVVAKRLGRNSISIEANPDYCLLAQARIERTVAGAPPEPELEVRSQ
jgi:hypothetical protein